MAYSGSFTGYFTGITTTGMEFTTRDHYPGDPNFSGTFCDKVFPASEDIAKKARAAFDNREECSVDLENGRITRIRRLVD